MSVSKAHIMARLQQEIMPLQGLKSSAHGSKINVGLNFMNDAFPNNCFPTGAIHEFHSSCPEDHAAAGGFVSGILGALMKNNGACLWISSCRTIFPPGLAAFGISPDHVIFIDLQKPRDVLWATEEALKCGILSAVVAEIPDLGFTASRRLQLAVEESRVTGFLLRNQPRNVNPIAAVARWKISSLPGKTADQLPGVGFPCWNVSLLKIRNGKPGNWEMEWAANKFRLMNTAAAPLIELRKIKTG